MHSKWHSISIKNKSYQELQEIQKQLPIRTSMPQMIEWLIKVGQRQIKQSELENDNTSRD